MHTFQSCNLLSRSCCCQQAGGKQPDSKTPCKSGSPGLEVTEEQLVAGEEEGAASIVEVYAALLLGFVTESDLAQQKASLPIILTAACSACVPFSVGVCVVLQKGQHSKDMAVRWQHAGAECGEPALQVVDAHLDGGMASVTAAVKRCLQFYVDANAITAKTEASLRVLIASLEGSDKMGS